MKIKVLKKTDLKSFKNKTTGKEGKRFSCLLLDKEGDYVEAICFIAEKYDDIEEGKTYTLQKFQIQKPMS
jgi:hypothetical protein